MTIILEDINTDFDENNRTGKHISTSITSYSIIVHRYMSSNAIL
jgi:hypothetical protein